MRFTFNGSIVLLALLFGVSHAFGQGTRSAPPAKVKRYTIEQFMTTTRVGGAAFSKDEKSVLFHSNASGVFNVYTVSVDDGQMRQLTHSKKESVYAVSYFPADERILYAYDKGGNENNHLYVRETDGTERELTPGDKVKANFLGWSGDKHSFYISTNERHAGFFDIYEVSSADYSRKLLYQAKDNFAFGDISSDGKYIAFYELNKLTDADIYVYNTETRQLRNLLPHQGEIALRPRAFDPSSRYLYYVTDEKSEMDHLARFDLLNDKNETVERADWSIRSVAFSPKGKYRATTINADAQTRLKIYDEKNKKDVLLPKFPDGVLSDIKFSDSEQLMAFYLSTAKSPKDLYVYNFETKRLKQITDSLNPQINAGHLVDAKTVRYRSFDGMQIPGLLYRPVEAGKSRKVPAVIFVHGAPGGQNLREYDPLFQYLLNHGYAIFAVNQRGSEGYGKTFFKADDRKHGREPLWDVVEAKKYLASLDFIDKNKIAIMGASGGGYMTLAALAFSPETFAVGVDIFGVSNWIRLLESIPPSLGSIRQAMFEEYGDPVKDREMLRAISPVFHADKIRRPLIVLQGANDPRVPKADSDEIVAAIRKNKGVVEYIVFPDEGHGFNKRANEIRANEAILNFLNKYLKGKVVS